MVSCGEAAIGVVVSIIVSRGCGQGRSCRSISAPPSAGTFSGRIEAISRHHLAHCGLELLFWVPVLSQTGRKVDIAVWLMIREPLMLQCFFRGWTLCWIWVHEQTNEVFREVGYI